MNGKTNEMKDFSLPDCDGRGRSGVTDLTIDIFRSITVWLRSLLVPTHFAIRLLPLSYIPAISTLACLEHLSNSISQHDVQGNHTYPSFKLSEIERVHDDSK